MPRKETPQPSLLKIQTNSHLFNCSKIRQFEKLDLRKDEFPFRDY
jgi:hypothetical protein